MNLRGLDTCRGSVETQLCWPWVRGLVDNWVLRLWLNKWVSPLTVWKVVYFGGSERQDLGLVERVAHQGLCCYGWCLALASVCVLCISDLWFPLHELPCCAHLPQQGIPEPNQILLFFQLFYYFNHDHAIVTNTQISSLSSVESHDPVKNHSFQALIEIYIFRAHSWIVDCGTSSELPGQANWRSRGWTHC